MPEVSTTVNARPEEVWALLRDFNGLGAWHPAMSLSMIEEGMGYARKGLANLRGIAQQACARTWSAYDVSPSKVREKG